MTPRRVLRNLLPPLVPFIVVTALAEVSARNGWIPRYLVPAPSQVANTLVSSPDLWSALGSTAAASVIGFGLSAGCGAMIAVALSSGTWVRRAFYPYAVFFQTVPIIAIAPLLVIWIGFDIRTVVASSVIVSIFPVIANTLTGLLSTEPAMLDLFRIYNAGSLQALIKLRLPAALPNILTGFRIAAGLAVIGAIVGEFITGGGLGGVIDVSRTQQRVDKIFAGLLLAALLGIGLFAVVSLISYLSLLRWHASERR